VYWHCRIREKCSLTNILSATFSMKTPATILIWPIRPTGAIYNGKLSKCAGPGLHLHVPLIEMCEILQQEAMDETVPTPNAP